MRKKCKINGKKWNLIFQLKFSTRTQLDSSILKIWATLKILFLTEVTPFRQQWRKCWTTRCYLWRIAAPISKIKIFENDSPWRWLCKLPMKFFNIHPLIMRAKVRLAQSTPERQKGVEWSKKGRAWPRMQTSPKPPIQPPPSRIDRLVIDVTWSRGRPTTPSPLIWFRGSFLPNKS